MAWFCLDAKTQALGALWLIGPDDCGHLFGLVRVGLRWIAALRPSVHYPLLQFLKSLRTEKRV